MRASSRAEGLPRRPPELSSARGAARRRETSPTHGSRGLAYYRGVAPTVVIVIGLVTLAGCNELWGLDRTRVPVPVDAVGCAGRPFGAPVSLPPLLPDKAQFAPQLSSDGRELWFVAHDPSAGDQFWAYRSTRSSTTAEFPTAVKVDLAQGREVTDPALTADGLRIAFVSRAPTELVLEATRERVDAPFSDPVVIANLGDVPGAVSSLDLSVDGLTLYYGNYEGTLWSASRSSLTAPFGDRRWLFDDARYPSVSPDQREIFYNTVTTPDGPVLRRVRADAAQPFDPAAVVVLDRGGDADVSPDGGTLVVSVNGGVTLLQRECRP